MLGPTIPTTLPNHIYFILISHIPKLHIIFNICYILCTSYSYHCSIYILTMYYVPSYLLALHHLAQCSKIGKILQKDPFLFKLQKFFYEMSMQTVQFFWIALFSYLSALWLIYKWQIFTGINILDISWYYEK